jgi:hypothetical protein
VKALRASSFEVVRATYWNTLLFPPIAAMRLWRRQLRTMGSDLARPQPSAAMRRVLGAVLAAERCLIRVFRLPFGLSVFVAARKV